MSKCIQCETMPLCSYITVGNNATIGAATLTVRACEGHLGEFLRVFNKGRYRDRSKVQEEEEYQLVDIAL
jgi:hypothetical protein